MFSIAGFGNPLLDLSVKIDEKTLLIRYNLDEDGERETDPHTLHSLLHDLQNGEKHLTPGGCVQNSLRVMQWMLQTASIFMFGSVGADGQGQQLKQLMESAGIQTRYFTCENTQTGTTIALVYEQHRSLVACLGAAKQTSDSTLQLTEDDFHQFDLVYMEGFFLEYESATELVLKGAQKSRIFAVNLSSTYVSRDRPNAVLHCLGEADVTIGGRREFEALTQALRFTGGVEAFAWHCLEKRGAKALPYGRMIVMTNGSEEVVCFHSETKRDALQIEQIPDDEFVDSIGAGDAFAAGFLVGLLRNEAPVKCLEWGAHAASHIIKNRGCDMSRHSANFMHN